MNLLHVIASLTQRATIVSTQIPQALNMPFFSLGDALAGEVDVVSETGDPTNPTTPVNIDGSTGIALTDGSSVVYCQGTNIAVSGNQLTFSMVVNSSALVAALTASPTESIEAFLEVRITQGLQDSLLLRQPTTIFQTATSTLPTPVLPVLLMYNPTITSLRGMGATSLESVATVSLGTGTFLFIVVSSIVSGWLLVSGAADPTDPNGQVAPLDYNSSTNNRHWVKSIGY